MVQVHVVPQAFRAVPGTTGCRLPPCGLSVRPHPAVTPRTPMSENFPNRNRSATALAQVANCAAQREGIRLPGPRSSCAFRSRSPGIPDPLEPSALGYNEPRKRPPKSAGSPFQGFGRAEMGREDAERIVTELFTSSYSAAARYAAFRCGSLDLAEDLVQEAFAALYARLREGHSVREPRAWVMRTVYNKICRTWRRTQRQPEQAIPRLALEALPLPTDGLADRDRPKLEAFLTRLSPREREVVLLRAQGRRLMPYQTVWANWSNF